MSAGWYYLIYPKDFARVDSVQLTPRSPKAHFVALSYDFNGCCSLRCLLPKKVKIETVMHPECTFPSGGEGPRASLIGWNVSHGHGFSG